MTNSNRYYEIHGTITDGTFVNDFMGGPCTTLEEAKDEILSYPERKKEDVCIRIYNSETNEMIGFVDFDGENFGGVEMY